jgi:putative ABC transport system permease protein
LSRTEQPVTEGLRPVAAGLAIGVLLSLAAGRLLGALLFDVRPGDPATIGVVVLLLGVVGVVACLVPARRAARAGTAAMLRLE